MCVCTYSVCAGVYCHVSESLSHVLSPACHTRVGSRVSLGVCSCGVSDEWQSLCCVCWACVLSAHSSLRPVTPVKPLVALS